MRARATKQRLSSSQNHGELSSQSERENRHAAEVNPAWVARSAAVAAEFAEITPIAVFGWIVVRWKLMILTGALGVLAAGLFATMTPPRYTTYVDMLLDPSSVQVLSEDLFARSTLQDALLLQVESKMRYLTSTSVLSTVVDQLDLVNDPEFVEPPAGFSLFSNLLTTGPRGEDATITALRSLNERVQAQREERSFVVSLRVWTRQPEKSVTIANAIVAAFQTELSKADSERASSAANALTTQIADLRGNVMAAESAVEEFRRGNGLQTSAGELVSSQSLTQLNSQLLDAQTRMIQAKARYDELSGIAAGGLGATDVIESDTLSNLRAQYSAMRQRIDAESATFGPRHPNIARLQPQLDAITQEIESEIARRVQSAATELTEAEMVMARLTNEIARARDTVSSDNAAQVQLRELERDAAAQARIYEDFLVRAGQIAQREQIDTTNVRVISPPVPPRERNFPPRTVILLTAGGVAGTLCGLALGVLLGFLSRIWPHFQQGNPHLKGRSVDRAGQ